MTWDSVLTKVARTLQMLLLD